jgi:hypothetical protein
MATRRRSSSGFFQRMRPPFHVNGPPHAFQMHAGTTVTGTPAFFTTHSMPRWNGIICPLRVCRPSGKTSTARPPASESATFCKASAKACGDDRRFSTKIVRRFTNEKKKRRIGYWR